MPVVLDISSDEEEGPKNTDFEWIKELLFTSDEESDDSDDVVVLHETKPKLKPKSSTLSVKDVVVVDDDCVVLEGDPENGVTTVEEEPTESDELVVVGEKGQVACRDFPHARHLCATFPFSTTPHERHCGQCHCYVCDSLAPCLKWGTGILSSDHCHANDKTEPWKTLRTKFKLALSSPLPASTNSAASLSVVHSQRKGNLPRHIIHPSPNSVLRNQASRSTAVHTRSSLNSIPQNQASRPTTMYARSPSLNSGMQNQVSRPINTGTQNQVSRPINTGTQNQVSRPINIPVHRTATNLTIPNSANHGRYLESGSTLVRDRNQPYSVPRPRLLGVRSHAIQRERGRGASSLGPQFFHSHMMSKGVVGNTGDTPTVNHSSRGSSGFNNHVNAVQQGDKFHTATGFSNHRYSNGPGDVNHPINLSFSPHSSSGPFSLNCVNQHTVTSETQAYSQAFSQSNDSQDSHQTCIQGNDAPYIACVNSGQPVNELQIRSQNENENANGNITQSGITSQDTCQPKPHEEGPNVTAERFSVFDSSWTENTSQNIEPVIECSPLQSSGSINQPPNVEESSTQVTGNIEPLNECHLSSSIVWPFDIDSAPMVTDGLLPFEFNIPSPDLAPVDSGLLLSQWW